MARRNRYITTLLLFISLGVSSRARDTELLDMASPGLKSFLIKRPNEFQCITNALSQAFRDKTFKLFYFYTGDQSAAKSFQTYPSDSTVNICIRENQEPVDQFICLLFETKNSEGKGRFLELVDEAEVGKISKQAFARGLVEKEFIAIKKTRDILKKLKLNKRDISASSYYISFIECPDKFNDYLAYVRKISSNYDPLAGYEADYDEVRANGQSADHAVAPPSGTNGQPSNSPAN
jgi:hypothetical protein